MSRDDYRNNEWYEYNGRKVYLVNTLFDGIARNAAEVDCRAEKPFEDDGFTVGYQDIYTMKDGMHIELCSWWTEGMSFWDLSIDKEDFIVMGSGSMIPVAGQSTATEQQAAIDRLAQSIVNVLEMPW